MGHFTILVNLTLCLKNDDQIIDLPGLSEKANFRQYSGYIDIRDGKHYFYWFVESQKDPENSLFGALVENGPFRVSPDGKRVDQTPWAWNTVANVVYLESPIGVGFSYSDDKLYNSTDESTAEDNHLFIEGFFKKYQSFKGNPFYIAGESYGGIYCPMLAQRILRSKSDINLKAFPTDIGGLRWQEGNGVIIGNGIQNLDKYQAQPTADFLLGHGLIKTDLFEKKIENCCQCKSGDVQRELSGKCDSVELIEVHPVNYYNIYDKCPPPTAYITNYNNYFARMYSRPPMMSFNANHYDDCPTYKHIDWINTPEVRKALHVSIDDTHKWADCTDGIYHYTKPTPQFPVINELFDVYNLEKFVAFNGNFDTMCDHITTQYFIDSLGISKMSGYRPWYKSDGSVAGYVQNYKRGVTWVLVLAAGHMVPQNQPDSALQMIKMVVDIKT
ncbi:unnamed protein product [Oppiella nova]|uniref:Carboxypeptidase n=1 Tax=Oppiella nova TaxID=334625 RepID=A0A7R9LQ42_9ACAR|nr:unnamed protein product [Oppiella nova]CAG2165850.1 unnamed protein product [Oppiella nova]